MPTFSYTASSNETVKLWSSKIVRDVYKQSIFSDMLHAPKNPRAIRDRDGKIPMRAQGLVTVHTEFQKLKGDRIRVMNFARVTGRGIHGDGIAAGRGVNLNTYTQDMFFENVIQSVYSSGELSEQRVTPEFQEEAYAALEGWAPTKMDEGIILALWGLTSWNNSPFDNWSNTGETAVFLNTIQTFDTNRIIYAGATGKTADSDLGPGDTLNTDMILTAETTASSDLDIPIEPFIIGNEPCYILFCNDRGKEQILTDPTWREAQQYGNTRSADNPAINCTVGRFSKTWVVPIPKAPNPAANVGRAVLCGKNALQYVPVKMWRWWQGFEDIAERRQVIAVTAMMGMIASKFNSLRRGSLAIDHYQRS